MKGFFLEIIRHHDLMSEDGRNIQILYASAHSNVTVCIDDLIKRNADILLKLFLLKLGFKLFKPTDDKS